MTFGTFLLAVCVPFAAATLMFGFVKGDNDYYDTEHYDGNGTAH